jgi:hypothetical protein
LARCQGQDLQNVVACKLSMQARTNLRLQLKSANVESIGRKQRIGVAVLSALGTTLEGRTIYGETILGLLWRFCFCTFALALLFHATNGAG